MQQEQESRGVGRPATPGEKKTKVLQAFVTPTEFHQVREIVYERRLPSISDWVRSLVQRELESLRSDERPAA